MPRSTEFVDEMWSYVLLPTRRVISAIAAAGQGGVAAHAAGVDEDGTGTVLHLGRGGHHERGIVRGALKIKDSMFGMYRARNKCL